jgi:gluconate 2-dehydrogenase gamma chain
MTTRRDILKAAAVAPLAFVPMSNVDAMKASLHATAALENAGLGATYVPKFFKQDEWQALRIVVDLIIPRDDRSGSATEAGVPEFMDWICVEYPSYQNTREALRWIDGFAYNSFAKSFAKCSVVQRKQLLDQIAWPTKAKKELAEGVSHFNRLRDFTASGFFSSQMGVKDLQYMGNVALPVWPGCPPAAMQHLGVDHDVMKSRIPSRY